jgi:hypothetical protein
MADSKEDEQLSLDEKAEPFSDLLAFNVKSGIQVRGPSCTTSC